VRCVHFMRTSAGGIITGEPLIGRVREDSKCLNKNHVPYEKQFPLLVHKCTHVFRFYNNTTLLERNDILCSELQRVAECWRNLQQMDCSNEFHAMYRNRRPGLPLSPAQSRICGGHNRTGTYEGWNFTSGNYLFTTDTK